MFGFLWLVLSLNHGQNFLEMVITDHVLSILIILLAKVVVLLLPGLAATDYVSELSFYMRLGHSPFVY